MFSKKLIQNNENLKRVSQSSEAYLLKVPPEVHTTGISRFLNPRDVSNLCLTSVTLFNTYNKECDEKTYRELQIAVIDNNSKLVKEILNQKPYLLMHNIKESQIIVSKKTGRKFYDNPNQALRPFTLATLQRVVDMVNLILPYFAILQELRIIENAKEEALAQWIEPPLLSYDFSNCIEVITKDDWTLDDDSQRVFDKATQITEISTALDDFRKTVSPKKITLDCFYDIGTLLVDCCAAFTKNYRKFNDPQRNLYCICIFGYLETLANPALAEVLCEGLEKIVVNNLPVGERAAKLLLLNHSSNTPFYPIPHSQSGCGFDFYIGMNGRLLNSSGYGVKRVIHLKEYYNREEIKLIGIKEKLGCSIAKTPRIL